MPTVGVNLAGAATYLAMADPAAKRELYRDAWRRNSGATWQARN